MMTNISKRLLTAEQEVGLFEQLSAVLADRKARDISLTLGELLGREERIMLAKRYAAILLIQQPQTPYFIAKTLELSPTTVGKLQDRFEQGEFKALVKACRKPTPALIAVFTAIDDLLHLGGILPHYGQKHDIKALIDRT